MAAAAGRGRSSRGGVRGLHHRLGTIAGLQRAGSDPGIVWLDAHGDVQTPETSTSGYLAGMALRLLPVTAPS